MGLFGGKNKSKAQDSLIKEQTAQLKRQQAEANAEKSRRDSENKKKADSLRRRSLGQSSLITTSELGVQDSLGV